MEVLPSFDLTTLDRTYGFEHVTLMGLDNVECMTVARDYPWIQCVVRDSTTVTPLNRPTTRTLPKTTMETTLDSRTRTEPIGQDTTTSRSARTTGQGETVMSTWLIATLTVTGVITLIVIGCILVSLVNLHERLNLRTRSNDDPAHAIFCCKVCLGICLFPVHLCAICCNCNWRNTLDLTYDTVSLVTLND